MVKACEVCGRDDNRIQIRAGTGICCNICDKIKNDDIDVDIALDYLWSINTNKALMLHGDIVERMQNAKSE